MALVKYVLIGLLVMGCGKALDDGPKCVDTIYSWNRVVADIMSDAGLKSFSCQYPNQEMYYRRYDDIVECQCKR